MEYTKGEWTVEGGTQVVSGNRLVANTGGYTTNYSFEREQNEANAKLIAAAPDMYQALKDCITSIKTAMHFDTAEHLDGALGVAKDAIAKAEVK